MKKKTASIIAIVAAIIVSLLLFQNLTPAELDEGIQSAMSEQQQTADTIQKNMRGPASVSSAESVQEKSSQQK